MPLGPGGKLIIGGLVGLVGIFLVWQFVVPFFFSTVESSKPAAEPTPQVSGSGIASTTISGAQGTIAAKPAKPALEGVIVDARTSLPLAKAVIKKADGTELALADSEGKYWLSKLPGDKDGVVVVAPGFESVPLPLVPAQAANLELKPRVINGTLVDADSQQPLAGKLVWAANKAVFTDSSGKFKFEALPDGEKVKTELIGYANAEEAVSADKTSLTLTVRSTVFNGSIKDAKTGKPILGATIKTTDNAQLAFTDAQGKFSFNDLKRDESTVLKIRAAGYKLQTAKASDLAKGLALEPFVVRAIYVPGLLAIRANYDELFTPYLEMADRNEINAIILDVKHDDDGKLFYASNVPIAKELNLVKGEGKNPDVLIDVKKVLQESHKRGLYVIARMVIMRDPAIAKAKPEWAIKNNRTGQPWQDVNKLNWPNQFVPEIAEYNASLALELSQLGFDEVQYDYIRFPTDGVLKEIQYKPDLSWTQLNENEKLRTDTINGIVKKAWDTLRTTDTFLSLDVFGMALWREDDNGIGQQYNDLVFLADYICPMVYATHFPQGTLDLTQYPGPVGAYPGVIIEKSGIIAGKLENLLKPIARYRPWLEDFSLGSVKHTPERVRLQLEAVDKTSNYGWQLWNAGGNYTEPVLAAWSKSAARK